MMATLSGLIKAGQPDYGFRALEGEGYGYLVGWGAMVIWIVGLSGAGKTTLGRHLVRHLRDKGETVLFLDGDVMREVWGDNLGHDIEGRRLNAHRISHLCRILDDQGVCLTSAPLGHIEVFS